MKHLYRLGLIPVTKIVTLSVFLSSCGGGVGGAVSGAGAVAQTIDTFQDTGDIEIGPICGNAAGKWSGTTKSGRAILLTLRQNVRCEITGEAAFPPCLPITPVNGKALLLDRSFSVEATNGGLFVENNVNTEKEDFSLIGSYRYTNIMEIPSCPKSESGTLKLTRKT